MIEVNEAFAGQYLAVESSSGLDREKVNVNGGAIALGHPLGSHRNSFDTYTAVRITSQEKKYGVATACIGGGQGIAMIVEAL